MDGDKGSDGFGRRGMESGRDGFAPEIDVCHFRKIINKKLDCILNASFIKGNDSFFRQEIDSLIKKFVSIGLLIIEHDFVTELN